MRPRQAGTETMHKSKFRYVLNFQVRRKTCISLHFHCSSVTEVPFFAYNKMKMCAVVEGISVGYLSSFRSCFVCKGKEIPSKPRKRSLEVFFLSLMCFCIYADEKHVLGPHICLSVSPHACSPQTSSGSEPGLEEWFPRTRD